MAVEISPFWWLSAGLHWHHCKCTGVTALLLWAIDLLCARWFICTIIYLYPLIYFGYMSLIAICNGWPFVNWVLFLSSSSWPGDVIWWYGSRSTLDQIVVCCLVAPSHYLNQWWPIITDGNLTKIFITAEMKPLTSCTGLNVLNWMLSQYHDHFCYYAASSWYILLYVVSGFVSGCRAVL